MKTKRSILAQSITLGLLLTSLAGSAYADKAPDVVTTDVNEFLNFDETKGTGLAKGKGVVVVDGDVPIIHFKNEVGEINVECEDIPNFISFKTGDAVTNVGSYGMVAVAKTGAADLKIDFEGKVLNINPALASPYTKSWDIVTGNGIYVGGVRGGKSVVNIKATELNIAPGVAEEADPFDRGGMGSQILIANAGIETNVGYDTNCTNAEVNIDLQGGDLNIKNMQAGIGAHGEYSTINIKNTKDINITSDTPKTGKQMLKNDMSEGIYNAVGIGATGGSVNIKASDSVNISNYSWGIAQTNYFKGSTIKICADGDINLKGTQEEKAAGLYVCGGSAPVPNERSWQVDITSGGKVTVEDFDTALVSQNEGAGVRITAEGDISLKSLGKYGISHDFVQKYVMSSNKGSGDIELTSKKGTVYIEGTNYGILNMVSRGASGKITINGNSEIRATGSGDFPNDVVGLRLASSNDMIFALNGEAKIIAENGTGIYISRMDKFTASGNLFVKAGDAGLDLTMSSGIGSLGIGGDMTIISGNYGIWSVLQSEGKDMIAINGKTTIDAGTIGIKTYRLTGNNKGKNAGKISTICSGAANPAPIELKGGVEIKAAVTGIDALGGIVDISGAVTVDAPAAIIARDGFQKKFKVDPEISQGSVTIDMQNQEIKSSITGSIVADDGGTVTIRNARNLTINSAILAANKFSGTTNFSTLEAMPNNVYTGDMSNPDTSTINIELGEGSIINGAVDDFAVVDDNPNRMLFDQAVCKVVFDGNDAGGKEKQTKEITNAGIINLFLSDGAKWNMTGDSSVTKLTMDNGITELQKGAVKIGSYSGAGELSFGAEAGEAEIAKAEADAKVHVFGSGADLSNREAIKAAIGSAAQKLIYSGYVAGVDPTGAPVAGERNLSGTAGVKEEGISFSGRLGFEEVTGRGKLAGNDPLNIEISGSWRGALSDYAQDNLTLTKSGMWNNTGVSKVRSLRGEGGAINMSEGSLNVANYSGKSSVFYTHEGKEVKGGDLTVGKATAGSEVKLITDNTGINMKNSGEVGGVLCNLARKIVYGDSKQASGNLKATAEIAEGLTTASAALKLADVSYDENGRGFIDPLAIYNPEIIYGSTETAMMRGAKSAMLSTVNMWRATNNDVMKRLGDLRFAGEASGIWAKYYGGKSTMDEAEAYYSSRYNAVQAGYDQKVGDWTVGAAFEHAKGKSAYTRGGKGDERVSGIALYGSKNFDDGQYFDIIAKAGRIRNDYKVYNDAGDKLRGDYSTNGMSIGLEYGKRFKAKAKGFYFEPSVELIYGMAESKNYQAESDYNGGKVMDVEQEKFESLLGKVGVRFGQESERSSYFGKLVWAHEFKGDFNSKFRGEGEPAGRTSVDLGGSWCELQLGMTTKLSEASNLYATVEKSFGCKLKNDWRVDAGLRFTF